VSEWLVDSDVTKKVIEGRSRLLEAYSAHPALVPEHFGIELGIAEGGYGRRQIYELVQNGADAALDGGLSDARVSVVHTGDSLYCANQGEPITPRGVEAILGAYNSDKRNNQIGRFGVGFKCVLAVSSAPQFFSRSGSFYFDPGQAKADIRAVVDEERTPALRMAYPLDPKGERAKDPVLAELMEWADTIVRLPLDQAEVGWLPDDLREFPAQFMLFSPHVGLLELDDRVSRSVRQIEASVLGDSRVLLTEDGQESEWRVVTSEVEMSADIRLEAGELADRDMLPLSWAVPLSTTQDRGQFWAFFPTQYWTTLRGILNAPWKTNADRQNLLESDFNDRLIERAASMVVDQLSSLSTAEDPARHLDYLPGRGREAPQWADALVTYHVYEMCRYSPSLPDLDGTMTMPEELRVHPANLGAAAVELFASVSRERDWVHPSAEVRNRRGRVDKIVEDLGHRPPPVEAWFGSLCYPDLSIEESGMVARLASLIAQEKGLRLIEKEAFIVTASGHLVAPDPTSLFFGDGSEEADGIALVHPELEADPEVRASLESLGIRSLDAIGRLDALLASADGFARETWEEFWRLSRLVPVSDVAALVESRGVAGDIRGCRRDGVWARIQDLLLPGVVVPSEAEDDDGVVLDIAVHAEDGPLLRALGVTAEPEGDRSPTQESWYRTYRQEMVARFVGRPDLHGRPSESHLEFDENGYAGPLSSLSLLSEESAARLSAAVIQHSEARRPWVMRHRSQSQYGKLECPNPALWQVRKHGVLATSLGLRQTALVVGPDLVAWSDVLPVADVDPVVAKQLELPNSPAETNRAVWLDALRHAADPSALGRLLAFAGEGELTVPNELEIADRVVGRSEIVVCGPLDDAEAIVEQGREVAALDDDVTAAAVVERFGLRAAAELFTTEIKAVDPEEELLVRDLFPDLMGVLPDFSDLVIVPSAEVVRLRHGDDGTIAESVGAIRDGDRLYVEAGGTDLETLLDVIDAEFELELDQTEREKVLQSRQRAAAPGIRSAVSKATSLAEKALAAIGREALARRVPTEVLQQVADRRDGQLDDQTVAEVALAVHGVDLLREHEADLRASGLQPPSVWAGSRSAREFVRDLGFGEEFAGFAGGLPDKELLVSGPPQLPDLHDFQRTAADNIRALVQRGEGRGLLSLPTGAGKTRTAVQALVESMADGEILGPVLWVAQTEELCEQAVSAWAENWRAHGSRERLRVSRLWSGNEAAESDIAHQVVVATDAKLGVVIQRGDGSYDWLSKAGAVVIDEAHSAVSPAYTTILDWLGMGRNKNRVPIIGLSATPFRGTSEVETERLVKRFGGHRFDDFESDPYPMLQDMGVLSNVRHRVLSGSNVELTAEELEHLKRTRRMPPSALERIGVDAERNQAILDSIASLPEDATVLLFATTVAHAELLAGLLSLDGIPAQAVSGRTPRGARRHYIERFRAGEIRVLTNYGVFTEGFDAPAVRAVYVARPTYSPNLYQQMIGRGLRGPLNGGKEECFIINVEDNLAEYGEQLAFTQFESLWNEVS